MSVSRYVEDQKIYAISVLLLSLVILLDYHSPPTLDNLGDDHEDEDHDINDGQDDNENDINLDFRPGGAQIKDGQRWIKLSLFCCQSKSSWLLVSSWCQSATAYYPATTFLKIDSD